jgi:hypothetical protein
MSRTYVINRNDLGNPIFTHHIKLNDFTPIRNNTKFVIISFRIIPNIEQRYDIMKMAHEK